jgi:hypothetical protein
VGAVLASVLWFALAFQVPLLLPYLNARIQGTGGVSSAYISGDSILVAALLGFVAAFAWAWRRFRRHAKRG